MMASTTYHGDGIVSKEHRVRKRKPSDPETRAMFYVRFACAGRRYTQQAGTTLRQARALLARLEEERRTAKLAGVQWVPPTIRKAQDLLAAELALVEREQVARAEMTLEFSAASEAFLKRHGASYVKPVEIEALLTRLGRTFAGQRLDRLTRADVQRYIDERLASTGVYSGMRGGPRTARRELAMLSRLYSFLIDEEGHEGLLNPCARAWKFRDPYRPRHRASIPTAEQRDALFKLADAHSLEFGAFLRLTYYTAARPESEPCALLHGDVTVPDRAKVRSISGALELGTVTYHGPRREGTKTGQVRTVPLHPEAEAVLRSVMLPEPHDQAERAAWAATPIFRRRDGRAWRQTSYRRAWRQIEAQAALRWPELAGMWPRDLRKAAITDMRNAGTERTLAAKIAGHSAEMSDHYQTLTDPAAREAILRLGPVQVAI